MQVHICPFAVEGDMESDDLNGPGSFTYKNGDRSVLTLVIMQSVMPAIGTRAMLHTRGRAS